MNCLHQWLHEPQRLGFVTGRAIQRFGAHPIICVGAVLTVLCVATNLMFPPVPAIEATGGWTALNFVVVPPTVIAAWLVTWHWSARARLAPAAAQ